MEEILPQDGHLIRRRVQLVAELACVPGAGDDYLHLGDPARREAEEAQGVEVHALYDGPQKPPGTRTLHHRQGDGGGHVRHVSARAIGVFGDPTVRLQARAGTGDDHEVLVVELVDGNVIYYAALLVAHGRVAELPRLHV